MASRNQQNLHLHLLALFWSLFSTIRGKYVVQAWNFNFPTWKGKAIPFWPHKHSQCGKNGIVFLFQVGKLKFLACKILCGYFEFDSKIKTTCPESGISGLEKTATAGELEFSSSSN